MAADRTSARNVWFYDSSSKEQLGGVNQNGSITNKVFYKMLTDVLLTVKPINMAIPCKISLHLRPTGHLVPCNDDRLETGEYDVVCSGGTIQLTDEACVLRITSQCESGQEDRFHQHVRARDKGCVLTGVKHPNPTIDDWTGFEAAHVFPLEKEQLFIASRFDRLAAGDRMLKSHTPINSCKNGLLLFAHVHLAFDKYFIAINPDDQFRITVFGFDYAHCDGRQLDPACRDRNDPNCVSTELLRWHFRQAVLANMKGAGEAVWEDDFPPGTDMVKEIVQGPKAAERMELELCSRLRGFQGFQN